MAARSATIERKTGETDVRLSLVLEGTGAGTRRTGVGFLDHMLDLLARHGRVDLDVSVTGDLQTGAHHTAEDTAIALGQALDAALGERAGIVRSGSATVPMDAASVSDDPARLRAAAGLVVPGVGSFPRGMENLRERGLDELLRERVASGVPVLGVCLGLQLAFESSTEHGGATGLGIIEGEVRRLEAGSLKLPHIG